MLRPQNTSDKMAHHPANFISKESSFKTLGDVPSVGTAKNGTGLSKKAVKCFHPLGEEGEGR